ncbi:MAG: (deoxy)nucleoside triphosphate pyrophosphohydrolase [Microlunatus sp.]|nr:(deoxy)nucleoside triphosphate pyrophosphohydrolase [Microlunatus sp.]
MTADPVRVVAAVFRRDGAVLACRRSPGRASGGRWEFPGGKIESGESGRDALRREILEELGVRITVGPLLDTSTTIVDGRAIELSCFLIEDFDPVPEHSTDHDQLRWLQPAALPELDFAEPDLAAVRLLAGY